MAIFGADVSYAQGTITWSTYAANKSFVWIKAGGADAGYYTDSFFASNQTGARAQTGLRIGYYYFGDKTANATTAANSFISILGSLNNGERLALDIEGANGPTDSWADTFCSTVNSHYGFTMSVYMSQFYTSSDLDWPLTTTVSNLWMANWSLASTDFAETGGVAQWGAGHANYNTLQYADNGTIPGISGLVDLDSFNGTVTDWDNLGFHGSPPPGTLTNATITNPSMTYTQPAIQTMNTAFAHDQVLYSNIWNTTISAGSWPRTISAPSTGVGQYGYVVGNFHATVNGADQGTNDFGVIDFGSSGYGQFPGNLPKVFVQPVIDSAGNLSFIVTYTPGGSATIGLTLNYAVMAYPGNTKMSVSTVKQTGAFSNAVANVSPSPYSTYRRIALDSSVGTGSSTVAHGQNTVPNLIYWVQDNAGTIEMQPVTWGSGGSMSVFGISMDASNIYFYVDSANNNQAWYRVYRDN